MPPFSIGTVYAPCVSMYKCSCPPLSALPSTIYSQFLNAPSVSPNEKCFGGTINSPCAAASRGSVIIGNGSISTFIIFKAFRAMASLSATTKAIGIPQKWTWWSAKRGSSGIMPPIWFSPLMSLCVKIRITPSSPPTPKGGVNAETSIFFKIPCAIGESKAAA